MNKFIKEFTITDDMAPKTRIITAEAILDLFQTVGGEHATILGVSLNDLLKKNLAWVSLRNRFEMLKPVRATSKVKVVTWPHPAGRLDFDRDYEILDSNTNELLVKGSCKWVIIDTLKRRIARTSAISYNCECLKDKLYSEFPKINDSDIFYEYQDTFKIYPSHTDILGHMNNSKYLELIYNIMPYPLKTLEINYLHEMKINDLCKLYLGKKDLYYYVKGEVNDVITFTSKFMIEE